MATETIFTEIWDSYKRVILQSIVTSFGLDFIVRDNYGGDVDTIRGVRETNKFKNTKYDFKYNNQEPYDSIKYHRDEGYASFIKEVRANNQFISDAYVPGNSVFYNGSKGLEGTKRANLDHVISASEIHNDPGRVLAGLDGVELANQKSNLKFTNETLNKSKRDLSVEEFIKYRDEQGNPLPGSVQKQMRKEDAAARKEYNDKIHKAYYSSNQFYVDVTAAAAKRGLEMGLRQALGLVFVEIWFACEKELKDLNSETTLQDCMQAIASGVENGVKNAMRNYKELLAQFEQGFLAGAVASFSTTLINIFVTTEKNMVRYIRQASVTVVQVGSILFFNPDELLLGDQLKEACIALATGASVLAGSMVGNQIATTPLGQHPQVGGLICNFVSALVSGLISCSLLILLDRSTLLNKALEKLNKYGSFEYKLKEASLLFAKEVAEIEQYDVEAFAKSVNNLKCYSHQIKMSTDEELNSILYDTFDVLRLDIPWKGDFDEFMGNKSNKLVFE